MARFDVIDNFMPKIDSLKRIHLDKAAVDHGFDLTPQIDEGWLRYRSTLFSANVWVQPDAGDRFQVGCDNRRLLKEVIRGTEVLDVHDPHPGMAGILSVAGYSKLYWLLGRIAALAQSLPTSVLRQFEAATKVMPKTTEAERLIVQRVGQSLFRNALIDYWESRCAVTGLDIVPLLRASHIKPWAKCANDHERLDVYNGFLLAPQLDAMFDDGWCTFTEDGCLVLSPQLDTQHVQTLGIHGEKKLSWIAEEHLSYLAFHRDTIYRAR
jgi:hypothetical protein